MMRKAEKDIHKQLLMVASTLSPELSFAIEQNGLLELVAKQDKPFVEQLCRTVVRQQLSLKAAASIWARLVASVPAEVNFVDYLVSVDPVVLRSCGLSGAKAKTVLAIAHATQADQLDSEVLSGLTHTERTQRLTALWGIGQWTADMMGIFYFADANIWPDGDITAKKTLVKLTSKRRKTSRTAAQFSPYRSYLALHMWQCVDAVPD